MVSSRVPTTQTEGQRIPGMFSSERLGGACSIQPGGHKQHHRKSMLADQTIVGAAVALAGNIPPKSVGTEVKSMGILSTWRSFRPLRRRTFPEAENRSSPRVGGA